MFTSTCAGRLLSAAQNVRQGTRFAAKLFRITGYWIRISAVIWELSEMIVQRYVAFTFPRRPLFLYFLSLSMNPMKQIPPKNFEKIYTFSVPKGHSNSCQRNASNKSTLSLARGRPASRSREVYCGGGGLWVLFIVSILL